MHGGRTAAIGPTTVLTALHHSQSSTLSLHSAHGRFGKMPEIFHGLPPTATPTSADLLDAAASSSSSSSSSAPGDAAPVVTAAPTRRPLFSTFFSSRFSRFLARLASTLESSLSVSLANFFGAIGFMHFIASHRKLRKIRKRYTGSVTTYSLAKSAIPAMKRLLVSIGMIDTMSFLPKASIGNTWNWPS